MVTPRTLLVSLEDVVHSFGFQLAGVREPRITQGELAERINIIAAKDELEQKFKIKDRRDELEKGLESAQAAIAESESIKEVTARLVRQWELGEKFPNDLQYQRIKEALNYMQQLTQEEENALDEAYSHGKRHALQGHKTEDFGKTLGSILFDRMESAQLNYSHIAGFIKEAGDLKETETLMQQKSALQAELDSLPAFAPKDYFITEADGKKINLPKDEKGRLKLTGEHLRLIEHGLIPSQDLYTAIIEGLSRPRLESFNRLDITPIDAAEKSDLQTKYKDLIREATEHFSVLKRRGLLAEDPLNGRESHTSSATQDTAQMPVATTLPEEAPVSTVPHASDTPSQQLPVAPAPIAISAAPIPPSVAEISDAGKDIQPEAAPSPVVITPAAKYTDTVAKRHTPKRTSSFTPSSRPGMVTRMAEIYVELFRAHDMQPPSNPLEPSDKVLKQLAKKLGQHPNDMDPLRPFSLQPLPSKLVAAFAGGDKDKMKLCEEYNRLAESLYRNISTYKAEEGQPTLAEALDAVEKMIKDDKHTKHIFGDIRKLNSETGISQPDFDEYFRHGGIRMGYGADITDVLTKVNNQWFKENDQKHNVFKQHTKQWRLPVVNYIDAHHAVQDEYTARAEEFQSAVERLQTRRHDKSAYIT